MNFGVLSNKSKDPEGKMLGHICERITCSGGNISFAGTMDKHDEIKEQGLEDTDILLSMGGDGTFLNIARQTAGYGIPIIGINTGSLGFLSVTDINDIDNAVRKIREKNMS